jgi:hypothetical protein
VTAYKFSPAQDLAIHPVSQLDCLSGLRGMSKASMGDCARPQD